MAFFAKIRHCAGVLLCVLCAHVGVLAQEVEDTLAVGLSRWDVLFDAPALALPTVAYQPETSWAFGAAGAWWFKINAASRTSELTFDGAYTLNKQYYVNLASMLYFAEHWQMSAKFGFRDYPDYFYGVGNMETDLLVQRERYDSRRFVLSAQPLYRFDNNWLVGLDFGLHRERYALEASDRTFFLMGLGLVASYDSRDNTYYPHAGWFFKATVTPYLDMLLPQASFGRFAADVRQFVPIYKNFGFAWQFVTEWNFGNDVPLPLLATLGGQDLERGIRRGVWRDDALLALQAEFRIPIWRFLKATVFGSVGDVYNLHHWQWAVPKVGYGMGLRVAINRAKTHIRFDVARQNYGNDWSFYLTLKEAF